jgi:predicted transcriptional regulator
MQKTEKPTQELVYYVMSVDRRFFVLKEFQHRPMLQASDVAEKMGRSLQNISHALRDLEEEKIVTCITPQKRTWRRYILTETGKQVLKELRKQNLI